MINKSTTETPIMSFESINLRRLPGVQLDPGKNPFADTLTHVGCVLTYYQLVKIADSQFARIQEFDRLSEDDQLDCSAYRESWVMTYNWAREVASCRFPLLPIEPLDLMLQAV